MPSNADTKRPEPPRVSLGRVAMGAPKVQESPDQEAVLRAIASVEGRMLGQLANVREEVADVKERAKASQRPPAPAQHATRLQHLAMVLTAAGAAIAAVATVVNAIKPASPIGPEYAERLARIEARVAASEAQRLADRQESFDYESGLRNDLADILDKLGVQVKDPPGTVRRPLEYLPPPRFDPHKLKAGDAPHPIQPASPLPAPPPP